MQRIVNFLKALPCAVLGKWKVQRKTICEKGVVKWTQPKLCLSLKFAKLLHIWCKIITIVLHSMLRKLPNNDNFELFETKLRSFIPSSHLSLSDPLYIKSIDDVYNLLYKVVHPSFLILQKKNCLFLSAHTKWCPRNFYKVYISFRKNLVKSNKLISRIFLFCLF